MLSLRNRFGIPGAISVVALVFALVGGAYAANGSGGDAGASAKKNAKKKKSKGVTVAQVRKIAKQEARKFANSNPGPQGPAGLPGATGAQGPKGDKGSNGSNGSDGSNGVSVSTEAEPPFGNCGEQEGVKLTSAGGVNYVCNGANGSNGAEGPEGSPWTAGGTLPSGETETGVYVGEFSGGPEISEWGQGFMPISFPLPLESAPEGTYVEGTEAEGCPGVIGGEPTAEPGHLCVYKNLATAGEIQGFLDPSASSGEFKLGVSKAGTVLGILCKASLCTWQGTWAVTAS